jgi:hypothetical protein|tara:strand:- start:179 stop:481 length:303 start_codon:yes stop_codon:yes gene_type:complete
MVIISLFLSTLVIASVITNTKKSPIIKLNKTEEPWQPTKEDIAFQDSMFYLLETTQQDLDTIRAGINKILWKLERFDYPDGTWDSIRYVKGGKIDKRRNK